MSERLPPLNALRAFEVAARHLNLRDAAEELHVTPAAIGQQVRALEAQLGVALSSAALVGRELQAGPLVRPFPPATFEATVFCYHLGYPERHRDTPKVRAFRDWLFAEMERDERPAS